LKAPGLPPNEAGRLSSLASYDVLDSSEERSFDDLTRLAALILEVPVALISLIDADRQWFKSHFGLAATQTPRDVSFCGHVVAEGMPLVVPDTSDDPRFADNPLSTGEPHVRFYAGMPLRNSEGFVLGTLCAIDHVPRAPTAEQLQMLKLLSAQVVDQLEARRRRLQLEGAHAKAVIVSRRLTALFEVMSEGVVVQDASGVITEANSAAERILGLTVNQLAGRTSLDPNWRSVHEDGSDFPGETHPAMVSLRTNRPSANVIMGVHKPEGELTWISINSIPIGSEGTKTGVITTFHDITALKTAQQAAERLSQQEHLITTGTLAAGVGHEINNPLAFISANLDFSIEELRSMAGGSPSSRMKELIEILTEARQGAERIRKIVRGLRALARQETEATPTELSAVVDVALSMAAHEIRLTATVSTELTATPLVLADEARLTQVLVNLLVNAAQAFPPGDIGGHRIEITSAALADGRVAVSVRDNGPGIPLDILKRIFDPFFTTKPVGKGTGLGLSICRSIVKALGGELLVESVVGTGTVFRLLLPAATASGKERPQAPALERGRVLVVDDEPAILNIFRRSLEREHQVFTCSTGSEALALLERGERFDVLFVDLMMPSLNGDALYRRVVELDVEMAARIVFMTGGLTSRQLEDFMSEVQNERVDKPFSVQHLRGISRRFVDAGRLRAFQK
jgi:PAS domain S-box-containing protein